MIRILHIVSSTFSGSGVMHFIMNYYDKIDKNKYQFDFLVLDKKEDNYDEKIKKLGGRVFYINKPSFNFKFVREVDNILKNNNYNIIHCHPIYSFLFVGIFKKKYNIKNIIQHSHTNKLSAKKISLVRNYLLLKLAPFYVTKYSACTESALLLFSKKDLEKKGYKIIDNTIDYSKYIFNNNLRNEIRNKYNIRNDDIIIGHVGRFSKEKNHEMILNVFEELLKKNKKYKLLFIGDGILKSKIIELSKNKKIYDKIIFTGNVHDVENYLCAMDIFLFPSLFEGFGLALLEAQLSGLNCITSCNIPDDVIITNNVLKCKLSKGEIINKILSIKLRSNRDRSNIKYDDKYDIKNKVNELIEFYNSIE